MTTSGDQILSLKFGSIGSGAFDEVLRASDIDNALSGKQANLTFGIANSNALKAVDNMDHNSFVITDPSTDGLVTKTQSEAKALLGLNNGDEVRFARLGLNKAPDSNYRLNVNGTSNFDGDVTFKSFIHGKTDSQTSFKDIDDTTKSISSRENYISFGNQYHGVNFVCRGNQDAVGGSGQPLPEGFCFFSDAVGNNADAVDKLMMYITSQSGNVGIRGNLALGVGGIHDSTNHSYKLDVDGNINLTGDIYQNGTIMKSGYWESMNETDTDISFGGNINVEGNATIEADLTVLGTITAENLNINGAADMELANLTVDDIIVTNDVTANTFIATSDVNYKENITKLDGEKALESILSLNGYQYNYIDDIEKTKKAVSLHKKSKNPYQK